MSDSPVPGVDGGNELSQKMAEATRCTIIRLDIRLNGIVAWADLTRSLTVRMKRSISGTYSFFIQVSVLCLERSFPCLMVQTHSKFAYV